MKQYISIHTTANLTSGAIYTMVDYMLEDLGIIVFDDQGAEHGITWEYLKMNFIEKPEGVVTPDNKPIDYNSAMRIMKEEAEKSDIPAAIYNPILSVITSYYFTSENFYLEDCINCFREFLKTQNLNIGKYTH